MFRLINDEVARAQLATVRSEIDRISLLVTVMDERITTQANIVQQLGEQWERAERSHAERIGRIEHVIADLRGDTDALNALVAGLDERLTASEGDNLQVTANLRQLERQAQIDLRELRSNGQSLASMLLQLRRGLDAGSGAMDRHCEQTTGSPASA